MGSQTEPTRDEALHNLLIDFLGSNIPMKVNEVTVAGLKRTNVKAIEKQLKDIRGASSGVEIRHALGAAIERWAYANMFAGDVDVEVNFASVPQEGEIPSININLKVQEIAKLGLNAAVDQDGVFELSGHCNNIQGSGVTASVSASTGVSKNKKELFLTADCPHYVPFGGWSQGFAAGKRYTQREDLSVDEEGIQEVQYQWSTKIHSGDNNIPTPADEVQISAGWQKRSWSCSGGCPWQQQASSDLKGFLGSHQRLFLRSRWTRDRIIYDRTGILPLVGKRLALSSEWGLWTNTLKTLFRFDYYFPLTNALSFGVITQGGGVIGLQGQDIHLSDRFFLGKEFVKGFEYGIGPGAPTFNKPTSVECTGGNIFYAIQACLAYRLAMPLPMCANVFFNMGSLIYDKFPLKTDPSTLWKSLLERQGCSVGFGLTSKLPNWLGNFELSLQLPITNTLLTRPDGRVFEKYSVGLTWTKDASAM